MKAVLCLEFTEEVETVLQLIGRAEQKQETETLLQLVERGKQDNQKSETN